MNCFYLIISAVFLVSCFKSGSQGRILKDVVTNISYHKDGHAILGPSNALYTADNIKVYYLQNGEKKEVNEGNLDVSKGFLIMKDDSTGLNYLKLYPNTQLEKNSSTATTLIQFGNDFTDTVVCNINQPNNKSYIVTRVWYNNQIKWDKDTSPRHYLLRFFTVNK